MKELILLVGQAKARMDTGFSRIGKTLDPQDEAQRALMMLASRCASIGNAVLVLAQHQHANEALPLLRSLFELSLRMRRLAQGGVRAEDLLAELGESDWQSLWDSRRLGRWMKEFGVPEAAADRLRWLCAEHAQANALGLPWGHVFARNHGQGFSSQEVLKLAALALGQALEALNKRWPGAFEGAQKIWEEARQ